jgi:ADP-heptose:LPS heptosyltransferase
VGVHASAWLAEAITPLAVVPDAPPAPFAPTPSEAQAAESFMARSGLRPGFLAAHPGSGAARKNWPPERFGEVMRASAGGDAWLLVRGPADEAAVAPLQAAPGAVVADGLPLRVLGAILGRAGSYLGNDSGVSHLAAAFGAPTLALFGPTDPGVWSPVGPRVRTLRSPTGAMDGLPAEAVRAAVAGIRGG